MRLIKQLPDGLEQTSLVNFPVNVGTPDDQKPRGPEAPEAFQDRWNCCVAWPLVSKRTGCEATSGNAGIGYCGVAITRSK